MAQTTEAYCLAVLELLAASVPSEDEDGEGESVPGLSPWFEATVSMFVWCSLCVVLGFAILTRTPVLPEDPPQ